MPSIIRKIKEQSNFVAARRKSAKIINKLSLNKGDIVIDCGSNLGSEVDLFLKKGCVVYSFEPNLYAYQALIRRFKNKTNVTFFNKAVLNKNGTIKLYLHKNSDADQLMWSTGSSIYSEKSNVNEDSYIEVECVDLSEFVESLHQRVKIIKMDIEGAEYAVLTKMIEDKTIRNIDGIYVETHDTRDVFFKNQADALRKKIKKKSITNIYFDWF